MIKKKTTTTTKQTNKQATKSQNRSMRFKLQ